MPSCPRGHNLEVEGDNGGQMLMGLLTENVEKRSVRIEYNARALTLIASEDNEVHGAVVRIDGELRNVRARKGVILCAGGFVLNQEMVDKFAPELRKARIKAATPGDDGSGIRMGIGAGGLPIRMHMASVTLPFYPPKGLMKGIVVNQAGQRFMPEDVYQGRAVGSELHPALLRLLNGLG